MQAVLDAMEWLGLNYDETPVYQTAQISKHNEAINTLLTSGAAYAYPTEVSGKELIRFRIPWDAEMVPGVEVVGPCEIDVDPKLRISQAGIEFSYRRVVEDGKETVVALRCLAGFKDLEIFDQSGSVIFSLNKHIEDFVSGKLRKSFDNASRFRFTRRSITYHDIVKGVLKKPLDSLSDFTIMRSDKTPVFHLANVVDDITQKITHIIRGDDHVENTYRHIFLFHALGATPPKYAHLPMIVNAQGKPYSKRDGAAYVGDFRAKGYLGEALFNYLALLGWSPGGDRELMNREEMAKLFTFDRVQSSAAQFDLVKLLWMNGEYMRALPREQREAACRTVLQERGQWNDALPADYLGRVLDVMAERIKLFTDIAEAGYFFTEDFPFDEKSVQKRLKKEGALEALAAVRAAYASLAEFTAVSTEAALRELCTARGVGMGDLVHPVRVAVSGTAAGPSLFHLLEVLGRERTLARMDKALERFGS